MAKEKFWNYELEEQNIEMSTENERQIVGKSVDFVQHNELKELPTFVLKFKKDFLTKNKK